MSHLSTSLTYKVPSLTFVSMIAKAVPLGGGSSHTLSYSLNVFVGNEFYADGSSRLYSARGLALATITKLLFVKKSFKMI